MRWKNTMPMKIKFIYCDEQSEQVVTRKCVGIVCDVWLLIKVIVLFIEFIFTEPMFCWKMGSNKML